MDWQKYLSREFLIACALVGIATVFLFKMPNNVSFLEWAGACGGFVAIFTGGLVTGKVKAMKYECNGKQEPPAP